MYFVIKFQIGLNTINWMIILLKPKDRPNPRDSFYCKLSQNMNFFLKIASSSKCAGLNGKFYWNASTCLCFFVFFLSFLFFFESVQHMKEICFRQLEIIVSLVMGDFYYGGSKIVRFSAKNQHPQSKLLIFCELI